MFTYVKISIFCIIINVSHEFIIWFKNSPLPPATRIIFISFNSQNEIEIEGVDVVELLRLREIMLHLPTHSQLSLLGNLLLFTDIFISSLLKIKFNLSSCQEPSTGLNPYLNLKN